MSNIVVRCACGPTGVAATIHFAPEDGQAPQALHPMTFGWSCEADETFAAGQKALLGKMRDTLLGLDKLLATMATYPNLSE